jgi:hypothetical protein
MILKKYEHFGEALNNFEWFSRCVFSLFAQARAMQRGRWRPRCRDALRPSGFS